MSAQSIHPRTLLFAHRGARAHAPDNTMEAFELAVSWGANGIETDAWLTADGVVVLDHDGRIRPRWRFRSTPISGIQRSELPPHIPTFDDLIARYGRQLDLSVDLKDTRVWHPIVEAVEKLAPDRLSHIWLCHHDIDLLRHIRAHNDHIRLVHSTRRTKIGESVEVWAQRLRDARIDALNLRQPDWSNAQVGQVQKFDVKCFMWDVQSEHHLAAALAMGIDALYSDHVHKMVAAAAAAETDAESR